MKKYFSALLCSCVVAVGCSDDESKPDKTELLVAAKWKMTYLIVNGNPQLFSECYQTNEFTFDHDKTYEMNSDCLAVVGKSDGTWEFRQDQSQFKWDYDSDIPSSNVFDIVKLDANAFELEADDGEQAIRFEAID